MFDMNVVVIFINNCKIVATKIAEWLVRKEGQWLDLKLLSFNPTICNLMCTNPLQWELQGFRETTMLCLGEAVLCSIRSARDTSVVWWYSHVNLPIICFLLEA